MASLLRTATLCLFMFSGGHAFNSLLYHALPARFYNSRDLIVQKQNKEAPRNVGKISQSLSKRQENTDDPSRPSLQTVTVTESGKTATGTYALTTLSQYTGLRESISVTLTSSTTKSNNEISVATEVAVVAAGGLAWALVGVLGDSAILQPPTEFPGSPSDSTCPSISVACGTCGGISNMCTTGTSTGCACQEEQPTETCPEGDSQPKCEDSQCSGSKDNECTRENAGCACKPAEPLDCPERWMNCEHCGGLLDGKCKGIEDENWKYKGCDCWLYDERFDTPDGYFGLTVLKRVVDLSNSTRRRVATPVANPSYPKMSPGSYADDEEESSPVCQTSILTAPQRDSDATPENPSVSSKIQEWCTQVDGQTISRASRNNDTTFAVFPQPFQAFWLSGSIWYNAPGYNFCGDAVKINKDECIDSLTTAMVTCDPNSGVTHGASLAGPCIQWNITIDTSQDPDHPPWNPRPKSFTECSTDSSGVQFNFFSGLSSQFCKAVNGQKDQALTKVYTNNDLPTSNSKRTNYAFDRRTPPPSPTQYPSYSFKFDWTGGNGDCTDDCSSAFSRLTNSPCGHLGGQQNTMSEHGSIDARCGKYSYEIVPPVTCGLEDLNPPSDDLKPSPASHGSMMQLAKWICDAKNPVRPPYGNHAWYQTTQNFIYVNSTATNDETGDYVPGKEPNFGQWDSMMYSLVRSSEDQTGCKSLKDNHTVERDSDCLNKFQMIADICTPVGKGGLGGKYKNIHSGGCWDYYMWQVPYESSS